MGLLDWLLPRTCAHCKEDLPPRASLPLCGACLRALSPALPPFCLRCAEPLSGGGPSCRSCAGRPAACRLIRAAYLYRGPIPELVHAFKYRGVQDAARAAGRWLAGHLKRFPEISGCDAVVPVPLHPRRLRERGYNQARLMAESLSALAGIPLLDALERTRATAPQWDLSPARRRGNLSGAFRAAPTAQGRSLLLIDDVCTTGASLEECARALRRAGARQVAAYVFARQTL